MYQNLAQCINVLKVLPYANARSNPKTQKKQFLQYMILINSVPFTQSVENINNQEVPELPYLLLWRNVNVIKACMFMLSLRRLSYIC